MHVDAGARQGPGGSTRHRSRLTCSDATPFTGESRRRRSTTESEEGSLVWVLHSSRMNCGHAPERPSFGPSEDERQRAWAGDASAGQPVERRCLVDVATARTKAHPTALARDATETIFTPVRGLVGGGCRGGSARDDPAMDLLARELWDTDAEGIQPGDLPGAVVVVRHEIHGTPALVFSSRQRRPHRHALDVVEQRPGLLLLAFDLSRAARRALGEVEERFTADAVVGGVIEQRRDARHILGARERDGIDPNGVAESCYVLPLQRKELILAERDEFDQMKPRSGRIRVLPVRRIGPSRRAAIALDA